MALLVGCQSVSRVSSGISKTVNESRGKGNNNTGLRNGQRAVEKGNAEEYGMKQELQTESSWLQILLFRYFSAITTMKNKFTWSFYIFKTNK